MANIFDVADYILKKRGTLSAIKLQKLVYYSQAWHLVWAGKLLFRAEFQSWAHGPVCPQLYKYHEGKFSLGKTGISKDKRSKDGLTAKEKEYIDIVLNFYGSWSIQRLVDQTHIEKPWRDARAGHPMERGRGVITRASMGEYYSSLSK